jgi:hypothetical protein
MFMNDGSPEQNLPLFLSNPVEGTERLGMPAMLRVVIVFMAATMLGLGVVAMAGPATRLAAATAAWIGLSTPRGDDHRPGSAWASTVDTQAPSAPKDTLSFRDAAVASEPAGAPTAEIARPSTADVLKQLQAWAADQDAKAQPAPVAPAQPEPAVSAQPEPAPAAEPSQLAQSVPDTPVRVEARPPAPVRAAPKQRPARSFQNARAEIRPAREARPRISRAPRIAERRLPEEEARATETPPQPAEPPSLMQIFGLRN